MALDVLFQSISSNRIHPIDLPSVFPSLVAADVSEAQLMPASYFLDSLYGDNQSERGRGSRAQTPMVVCPQTSHNLTSCTESPTVGSPNGLHPSSVGLYPRLSHLLFHQDTNYVPASSAPASNRPLAGVFARLTRSTARQAAKLTKGSPKKDGTSFLSIPTPSSKQKIPRPSALPQRPVVDDIRVPVDAGSEYAIVISMYEVYNDRIFDLLGGSAMTATKGVNKRRALLFNNESRNPERKAVKGLKKVVCTSLEEAIMVLETGITERKVAGTGSNAVSSRSHGFFCVEVKKRDRVAGGLWTGNTLTIVDLAGMSHALNLLGWHQIY